MAMNSPTSIIVYNQCPRLYYYQYLAKKPSYPHIDLIKGTIVHQSLQKFFGWKPGLSVSNSKEWCVDAMHKTFLEVWNAKRHEIAALNIPESEISKSRDECIAMLNNWLNYFQKRVEEISKPLHEAFDILKPLTEDKCYCDLYEVQGLIDAIESRGNEKLIIDYKTTSKFDITKEYWLQLSIYAFLYLNKYKKKPDKAGIFFLKERLHLMSVDNGMIDYGESECKKVHDLTKSRNIADYPMNSGYLCKALRGRCPCRKYELGS